MTSVGGRDRRDARGARLDVGPTTVAGGGGSAPPVALTLNVVARVLAEIGRAEDQDLEPLWPCFVAAPRAGRDAHHVPLLYLGDLVVELHPPAPAHDHVDLLLLPVRVAVRESIAGRDALVAQAGLFERERIGRQAELEIRRAVLVRPDIRQICLQVPERERHVLSERRAPTDRRLRGLGPCSRSTAEAPLSRRARFPAAHRSSRPECRWRSPYQSHG